MRKRRVVEGKINVKQIFVTYNEVICLLIKVNGNHIPLISWFRLTFGLLYYSKRRGKVDGRRHADSWGHLTLPVDRDM